MFATLDMAQRAKPLAVEEFSRFGEVVGVGVVRVGDGYGVKVNFRRSPSAGANLPTDVDGVPVSVAVVGIVRQQQAAKCAPAS